MNFRYTIGSLGSREVETLRETILDRRDGYADTRFAFDFGLVSENLFESLHYLKRCEVFM